MDRRHGRDVTRRVLPSPGLPGLGLEALTAKQRDRAMQGKSFADFSLTTTPIRPRAAREPEDLEAMPGRTGGSGRRQCGNGHNTPLQLHSVAFHQGPCGPSPGSRAWF